MTSETTELSHPIRLDRISTAPITVALTPNETVRARLAERFELEALDHFAAELTVRRLRKAGWIEVAGRLTASVVQTCVVTTDPVPGTVETEILELLDDSGEIDPKAIDLDPLADTPEPIAGDVLDVGEIAVQAFGLALDPYPRKPGAEVPETAAKAEEEPARTAAPFAKLAALKDRSAKKG